MVWQTLSDIAKMAMWQKMHEKMGEYIYIHPNFWHVLLQIAKPWLENPSRICLLRAGWGNARGLLPNN
jgi:hypothetical protein